MSSKFPRLLEPIKLRGGAVLRNRALMGSMHTGACHAASPLRPGSVGCAVRCRFRDAAGPSLLAMTLPSTRSLPRSDS
eukprot:scaffold22806_cov91-Isochrysis_galbana.AAC.2